MFSSKIIIAVNINILLIRLNLTFAAKLMFYVV